MKRSFPAFLAIIFTAMFAHGALPGLWQDTDFAGRPFRPQAGARATAYRALALDVNALRATLARVPVADNLRRGAYLLVLPRPDGTEATFRIARSPVMEAPLAAAFPELQTYAGQGVDDPTATVRFDLTPYGFHAMVLSAYGTWLIDPVDRALPGYCISYFKRDALPREALAPCQAADPGLFAEGRPAAAATANRTIEGVLRTYRLALACTGEYAAFYGGTVGGALAGMVTTMNRVNGIYEREFGIHMNLVANDTVLIFTNASTDPYTNNSGFIMLGQNQTTCSNLIGSANYDIGHVFSTGGGGIAELGVVCINFSKARGVTGLNAPIGDAFDVDYVAHEMGHQFGGNHTFNTMAGACGGNWAGAAAFEPGSGSTIMAYAGICAPQNLQVHSDDYFHTGSFDEIIDFSQLGVGNVCPVKTFPANLAPVLNVPVGYTIPLGTPFRLTATATDPDGDTVTYCWEEHDLGPSGNWNTPSGNAPIFRSFNPVLTGTRLFPKLANILANNTSIGEIKPSYARTLTFRCTARDNILNGAGVTYNDQPVVITVASSGPFEVTSPNTTGVVWNAGTTETVTWNVNGTDQPPVSASAVNVLLSVDGGQSFPTVLGTAVPNNGSLSVTVPNVSTNTARVMVEGDGNVFFDINNFNFTINPLGVEEASLAAQVSLYPNPAAGETNLVVAGAVTGTLRVVVTDAAGRVVRLLALEKRGPRLETPLGLAGLPAGVYTVQVVGDRYAAVSRVTRL